MGKTSSEEGPCLGSAPNGLCDRGQTMPLSDPHSLPPPMRMRALEQDSISQIIQEPCLFNFQFILI